MIYLTRLSGHKFWLNADLIESMEQTPDTVVVLADGRRLVILEPASEVVEKFIDFRASVLLRAGMGTAGPEAEARLSLRSENRATPPDDDGNDGPAVTGGEAR